MRIARMQQWTILAWMALALLAIVAGCGRKLPPGLEGQWVLDRVVPDGDANRPPPYPPWSISITSDPPRRAHSQKDSKSAGWIEYSDGCNVNWRGFVVTRSGLVQWLEGGVTLKECPGSSYYFGLSHVVAYAILDKELWHQVIAWTADCREGKRFVDDERCVCGQVFRRVW